MWMWIWILIATLLAAGASLMYLVSRFYKFPYTIRFSRNKKGLRILFAALPVVLLIVLSSLLADTMNMMVIVIALSMIWLLCDFCAWITGRIIKRRHTQADTSREGRFKKIRYLYPAGICALLLTTVYFLCGWFFAHHVFETDYVLHSDKISEPFRIVLFADAHMGTTFDEEGFAKQMLRINETHPDAVVIAGDLVDDSTSYAQMDACCRALKTLQPEEGVFYAYGNHDKGYSSQGRGYGYAELEASLAANGVVILEDAVYDLSDHVTLIGRADASTGRSSGGYEMGERSDIATLLSDIPEENYTVVLDHQPNDYAAEAAAGADLVLSGHTHGGQLIPINRIGELIGANDRTYGYERIGHTDFIVTSGISAWSILFKTGCKSEYVVIDIVPNEE